MMTYVLTSKRCDENEMIVMKLKSQPLHDKSMREIAIKMQNCIRVMIADRQQNHQHVIILVFFSSN